MMLAFVKLGLISEYHVYSDDKVENNGVPFWIFLMGIISFIVSIIIRPDDNAWLNFFLYSLPLLFTTCWCGFACIGTALDKDNKGWRLGLGLVAIFCYMLGGVINFGTQIYSLFSVFYNISFLDFAVQLPMKLISFICFIFIILGKKIRWWINLILFIFILLIMAVYVCIGAFFNANVNMTGVFTVFFAAVSFLLISSSNTLKLYTAVALIWMLFGGFVTFIWIKDYIAPSDKNLRVIAAQYGRNLCMEQLKSEGNVIWLDDQVAGVIKYNIGDINSFIPRYGAVNKNNKFFPVKGYRDSYINNITRKVDEIIKQSRKNVVTFSRRGECQITWGVPNQIEFLDINIDRKNRFGEPGRFEAMVRIYIHKGVANSEYEERLALLTHGSQDSHRLKHKADHLLSKENLHAKLMNDAVQETIQLAAQKVNQDFFVTVGGDNVRELYFTCDNNEWKLRGDYGLSYNNLPTEKFSHFKIKSDNYKSLCLSSQSKIPLYMKIEEKDDISRVMNNEINYKGEWYDHNRLQRKLFSEIAAGTIEEQLMLIGNRCDIRKFFQYKTFFYDIFEFDWGIWEAQLTEMLIQQIDRKSGGDLIHLQNEINNSALSEFNKERCLHQIEQRKEKIKIAEAKRQAEIAKQKIRNQIIREKIHDEIAEKSKREYKILDKLSDGKIIPLEELKKFFESRDFFGIEYSKLKQELCVLAIRRINKDYVSTVLAETAPDIQRELLSQFKCSVCKGTGLGKCRICRGSGTCQQCEGSGRRKVQALHDENGQALRKWTLIEIDCSRDCSRCRGTGKRTCFSCGGSKLRSVDKTLIRSLAFEMKKLLKEYSN